MKLQADTSGLDAETQRLMQLPGIFAKARKRALSSIGWRVQQELRNHVEYGGSGDWPKLHPLSQKFKKKRGAKLWSGTRRQAHNTALFWLGKFSRYRVDKDGELVDIDFGKSRKGKPGTFDPEITAIVKRAEQGETIHVTDKMRRFWATTRRKRPKKQIPGKTFFPLRKETTKIEIPPRPMIGPVWRKMAPKIPALFAKKFYESVEYYRNKEAARTARAALKAIS